MFGVFGKMLLFGIKVGWGLMKFLFSLIFLPIILIGMVMGGLLYLAIPVLIIIGIIVLLQSADIL